MANTAKQVTVNSAAAAARDMVRYGQVFYSRGWNLATSSNYSAVLSERPLRLLMTASGKHKGELVETDFVVVDESLKQVDLPDFKADLKLKPSAEAALHIALAKQENVKATLHTHSVWATIVSERFFAQGAVELHGYEMLKALPGVASHEETLRVAILDNTQDMVWLAQEVTKRLDDETIQHAFLLKGHGLYTWGPSLAAARNQIEALEFLFEVIGRAGG